MSHIFFYAHMMTCSDTFWQHNVAALLAGAAAGVVVEASAAPGCLFWTAGDLSVPKKYWSSMYWRPLKPKIHLTYTLIIHYLYQPMSYPFLLDKSSPFQIWSPLKSPCFQTIVALPGVSIAAWRGMKPAHVHRYGHTESRKSHRFQRLRPGWESAAVHCS